jgi:DNA-binding IclR family transcriptional regulator
MDGFLAALAGLRAQVPDRVLMDLVDLQVLVGDRLPARVPVETLSGRWGISGVHVSTRMSQLRKLGLVRYDRGSRGSPGYEVWGLGPRPAREVA